MQGSRYKRIAKRLLDQAGIPIGGRAPHAIHVHDERFYARVLAQGSVGLGESYMDGWWDCKRLDEFFTRLLNARLDQKVRGVTTLLAAASARLFNLQRHSKAFEIGRAHYDIGNDLYTRMLDPTMSYSCGYWKDAKTLEQAQRAKLDLTCRKLQLKKSMALLDIGCGWGSLAKHAAKHYGVKVVGITVSEEQVALARERCKGLPVTIRYQDYRDIGDEKFDRIVSIGMFEHVGVHNYRKYFEVAREHLKDDGLFLLHTIGRLTSGSSTDPWISKYIFPRSMLPSLAQITKAAEKLFVIEDVHNFSAHYYTTLMAWHKNINSAWHEISSGYDERFRRMWNYYLLSCAGSFNSRKNQLWQIVLSKEGIPAGYDSIR